MVAGLSFNEERQSCPVFFGAVGNSEGYGKLVKLGRLL